MELCSPDAGCQSPSELESSPWGCLHRIFQDPVLKAIGQPVGDVNWGFLPRNELLKHKELSSALMTYYIWVICWRRYLRASLQGPLAPLPLNLDERLHSGKAKD